MGQTHEGRTLASKSKRKLQRKTAHKGKRESGRERERAGGERVCKQVKPKTILRKNHKRMKWSKFAYESRKRRQKLRLYNEIGIGIGPVAHGLQIRSWGAGEGPKHLSRGHRKLKSFCG